MSQTPADLYAQEMIMRAKAKAKATEAAALRLEAKGEKRAVEAYNLRARAKALSAEAAQLRNEAKLVHREAVKGIGVQAEQMVKRMPPEFGGWGILKTRAYTKLLDLLVSQAKRVQPNLALATQAHTLLLGHAAWTDAEANRLGCLPKHPKSLA
ncbi:hypothetical protein WKI45_08970 [Delftia tsuruhatensis]|uniref:hypothetical protein n=1 Tax=Delftia TaxID=80865 RepID=UPI000774B465|nr:MULTISPECIES: hypothetical protein [Delftia]MPT54770.1 hypothetical protein [Delftia sp.]SFB22786.1 hypothetical protein SAMN05444579_103136 [Delftia tsuruhatensis]